MVYAQVSSGTSMPLVGTFKPYLKKDHETMNVLKIHTVFPVSRVPAS